MWFPWRVVVLTLAGLGVFLSIYVPWRLTGVNQLGPLLFFFLGLWVAVVLLATVSISEATVLGDIQRGTASWLVSMPISRNAVIVAKFIAASSGMAVAILLTGGLLYPLLQAAERVGVTSFTPHRLTEVTSAPIGMWGQFASLPDPGAFGMMLVAMWLLVVFLIAVMILLGALVRSRTLVFGLGLAVFAAMVAAWFGARDALEASPIGLVGALSEGIQNRAMTVAVPAAATIALSLGLVALAAWRFQRKELR
jgi:ABC-type transport system involved in multi-copper enzyme maturation permease subunit